MAAKPRDRLSLRSANPQPPSNTDGSLPAEQQHTSCCCCCGYGFALERSAPMNLFTILSITTLPLRNMRTARIAACAEHAARKAAERKANAVASAKRYAYWVFWTRLIWQIGWALLICNEKSCSYVTRYGHPGFDSTTAAGNKHIETVSAVANKCGIRTQIHYPQEPTSYYYAIRFSCTAPEEKPSTASNGLD